MSEAADGRVLSAAQYRLVVDAIHRWRAFAVEMADVFEEHGRGRGDTAYQGALNMVALADQALKALDAARPVEPHG